MDELNISAIGGGVVIGLLFGLVMQRSRFCLVAAVSNMILIRDSRHLQAFFAAWAVAIAGTALLESMGLVAIAETSYRLARIDWFGATAGGLLFGFGAALAGGCAARTLISTAEGHIGGLLTLIMLILFSGMSYLGSLEPARVALLEFTAAQLSTGDSGVATLLHIAPGVAGLTLAVICIIAIRLLGPTIGNHRLILAGGAIGLLVVMGWFVTGWLVQDEFTEAVAKSVIITGPLARLNYSLATGTEFPLTFNNAFIFSIFVGATISALIARDFRWTSPDPARIPHNLIGGALMGIGAIMAGGCNIGQGITGLSTLSITSIIAATAIFIGVAIGIKWWERYA